MRVSLLLVILFSLLGVSLWATLTGVPFILGALGFIFLLVITVGYADTAILFFLGAREVRSTNEPVFFESASQQAYKLSVPRPKLYFYNGTLERGFILEAAQSSSIVLSKSLLSTCHPEELDAICFELLLQLKKGMAAKRTRVMFLLGTISWSFHAFASLLLRFSSSRELRQSTDWFLNYFLHPWMSFIFSLTIGEKYFKRLRSLIAEYPVESERLARLGLKLRWPSAVHSLPSRKLIELSSIARNKNFQNILALEFLPHEWDVLFNNEDSIRAQQA